MKKSTGVIIQLIVTLSASSTCFARVTSTASIDFLRVYKESVIVTLSEPLSGTNCVDSKYVKIPHNVNGGKELYSAVLSAYMADRDVSFGVHDACVSWGPKSVSDVYRVDIHK